MKKIVLLFVFLLANCIGYAQSNIAVTNTNSQTQYISGTQVTYTASVKNLGPAVATNVFVKSTISNAILQKSWTGPNSSGGTGEINNIIPTLAVGQTVNYIITITVPVSFAGNLNCRVQADLPPGVDPNTLNNWVNDQDTKATTAEVLITNTNNQNIYTEGATNTYTVNVVNNGPLVAEGVSVTGIIPAGITSYSWTGSNGSSGTNVPLVNAIGDLPAGQVVTYTVIMQIPSGFTGNIAHQVSVSSETPDNNIVNNTATDTDLPLTGADIVIVNTDGQTTYQPGTQRTYTITVSNNGPTTATNVVVSYAIPATVTAYSWTGSNGSSGTNVPLNNNIPTLAVGASVTYTFVLTVPIAFLGNFTTNASFTSTSVDLFPNCPQCADINSLTPVADIQVVNSDGLVAYIPGQSAVYTVRVTNLGPQNATNVQVSNPIPAGITNFTWTGSNGSSGTNVPLNNVIPNLAPGNFITYTITMQIPASLTGNLSNIATANSSVIDINTANNTATDTDILGVGADIVVTNTDGLVYHVVGGTSVYTITVKNNGPSDAVNVLVNNPIPAGIVNSSWSGNGASGTNTNVSDVIPILAVGSSVVYTFTIQVPPTQTASIVSTTSITSNTSDPNPACTGCADTSLSPINVANIIITNTEVPGVTTYVAGQTVVYVVTVQNNLGPSIAQNVVITGSLPAGINLADVTWTGNNGTSGTGNLNDTLATLGINQSVVYTVTVPVPANFPQTSFLIHQVSYTSSTIDPSPACPLCRDLDTPAPLADIVTFKTNNQTSFLYGENVVYTVTVRNDGPSDALNVVVNDPLPVGTNITQMTWSSSTGSSGTGGLNETIPVLPVNGMITYNVTLTIPSSFTSSTGNLVNTVNVTSATTDPVPNCPTCSDLDVPRSGFVTVDTSSYSTPINGVSGPERLIKDVLINEPCVELSNFDASSPVSFGYFHRNNSDFAFKEGIVIRTGNAQFCEGKYTGNNISSDGSLQSDPDLDALNGNTQSIDRSYVKFDFVPTVESFSFNFIFASNEYGQNQCSFGDTFAFILTNLNNPADVQNLAIVPGTTSRVSVDTVRNSLYNPPGQTCASVNPLFFDRFNESGIGPNEGPASSAINLKGQTVSMVASANVIPNTPYSIKLVIADAINSQFDSAVFLEAGSFNIGGPNITGTGAFVAYTDFTGSNAPCEGSIITIQSGTASNPNITYSWLKDGNIIPNASNYNLVVSEPGTYTVIFTYANSGCQQSDDVVVEYRPQSFQLMNQAEDLYGCNDGTTLFDLTLNEPIVITAYDISEFETFYYTSLEAATSDTGVALTDAEKVAYAGTNGQDIWMKMVNIFTGGSCDPIRAFKLFLTTPPSGTFDYTDDGDGELGFCINSNTNLLPTAPNLSLGGTYSAEPTGLTIDPATGAINLFTSLAGTYTVTYAYDAQGCTFTNPTTEVVVSPCSGTIASNSGNVCVGTTAFNLFATNAGFGATYEWKDYNGVVFSTDKNPLSVAVPTLPGNYNYTVIATLNGSSSTSTTTLVVLPLPIASFVSVPTSICTNATTTLVFAGTPGATLNFTDGTNPYSVTFDTTGSATFITPALAVDTSYTLVDVIGTTCSGPLSASLQITVGLPTASIIGFTNTIICSGTASALEIQGTPGATVAFTKGGVAQPTVVLPSSGTLIIPTGVQTVAASTTYTYALTNVTSNSMPPCSDTIIGQSATLTVNALPTASISNTTPAVCAGTAGILTFSGTPNATIIYSDGAQNYTVTLDGTGSAPPVTTALLSTPTTFTLVSAEVTDTIVCSQNITGNTTIGINQNPAILGVIANDTVCPAASKTFTVVATGAGLTYQWYFNNALIPGATNALYTIASVVAADAGNYYVKVSGSCGTAVDSNLASLSITPTTVITGPTPITQTVCTGEPISISISAIGAANLTYQWFKGTLPIPGATSNLYTVSTTVLADSGTYTCQVTSGSCGTVTSAPAAVTVNLGPAIVNQTGTEEICVGQTATYTVVASGTNLTYQWYKGTTAILGATSSTYTFANATETDSGDYYCDIASLSCPNIQSVPVTLVVNPLPTATILPQGTPAAICAGQSSQISFSGTPGAVVTYTINGGTPETITLNPAGGLTLLDTGSLNETAVFELVSVTYTGPDACSQNVTGSATVIVTPLPVVSLEDGYICIDPVTLATTRPYLLNTGLNTAEYTFEWFDANGLIPQANNSFYEANIVGQYSVTITDIISGCQASAFANVDQSLPPTDFTYTVSGFFADNPTVVITPTPAGVYEYQLDFGPFQDSNVFDNIESGTHTITVRDSEVCDVLTKEVLIIDYPKYFTPNGDGINDTWNIPSIKSVSMSKIYIFDQFGKLIKEMSTSGLGWDGTFNGQVLPATDYWFTINYEEAGIIKEFRSHFSLKR